MAKKEVLDDQDLIRSKDPSGMLGLAEAFALQCREALAIGRNAAVPREYGRVNKILVTGLGGSAIGGEYMRTYLAKTLRIPFLVNRHYVLPGLVDKNTLVIAVSYSGNTEETLSAASQALRAKAKVVMITNGGELQKLAAAHGKPCILVPKGRPPRATLGLLFFTPLCILEKLGLIGSQARSAADTVAVLEQASRLYGRKVPFSKNPAKQMAWSLFGKGAIIYAGQDYFDAVAMRWKGQINENSKSFAVFNVFPEMNHNEIVGWEVLKSLTRRMGVIFLRDTQDHPRVQLRMKITQTIIRHEAGFISEVWAKGASPLAKMFYLTAFGDFVSIYLAFLNGVDPTSVDRITYLKKMLAKS